MKVFFDECGSFDPWHRGRDEICAVMGVIIPESESRALKRDFEAFVRSLPRTAFTKGEPKRAPNKPEHCLLLAQIITAHSPVMLVPVTLLISSSDAMFLEQLPGQMRQMCQREAHKYLKGKTLSQLMEWAARSGNLSPVQWFRLAGYAEAVFRARTAIAKFYRCSRFISNWKSVQITFDRVGRPRGREELVLDLLVFLWAMMRLDSSSQFIDDMKQALESGYPFPRLANLRFLDSRTCWQLQLADMLVRAWTNTVQDSDGTRGHLEQFRLFHQNTINSPEDALGMLAFGPNEGFAPAPERLDIFSRIAIGVEKIAPCGPA